MRSTSTTNDSMSGVGARLNPFSYHPTKCQKTDSTASRSLIIVQRYAPRQTTK